MNPELGFPAHAPLRVHPVHILDDEDFLLVDLWQACRGGEISGLVSGMAAGAIVSGPIGGHLPEPGGVLDQVNCVVEGLAVIESAFLAVKPKPGKNDG